MVALIAAGRQKTPTAAKAGYRQQVKAAFRDSLLCRTMDIAILLVAEAHDCKCEDALASGSVVGIVNITSYLELLEALYL